MEARRALGMTASGRRRRTGEDARYTDARAGERQIESSPMSGK